MKNLIAFFLIFGFTIRYLLQVPLEMDAMFLELLLYGVLLISINYNRQIRYLPFLIVMSLLVVFNTQAVRLVFIILLCFFYQAVDIRKIALYNCLAGGVFLLIVWYLVSVGILENEHSEYLNGVGHERVRNSLGLGYNAFSLYVSSLLMNLYILMARKNAWLVIVVLTGLAWLCFSASGSRTSFVGEIILVLTFLLSRSKYRDVFLGRKILLWLPLILTAGTILCSLMLDRFMILNLLTSNRLYLTNAFLHHVSITDLLFGTSDIMTGGNDEITIDNIYMHLLFEGGVLFYAFFYSIYVKWVKSLSDSSFYLVPVVITSLVIGLGETNFLSVAIIGNSVIWGILYQGAYAYDRTKSFKLISESCK